MKPHEQAEEAEVIRKAKEGRMDAFESLVRRYERPIYSVCLRLVGAHQSADDLAQETFIKAYFALSRFDEKLPLYPWLRRIAVNAALNLLKARRRERPLEDPELRTAGRDGPLQPDEAVVRAEFEADFEKALGELPPEQKSVFVLRFYENLSYDEMSRLLDLPVGTVMSRLNRARQKLKALLADTLLRRA